MLNAVLLYEGDTAYADTVDQMNAEVRHYKQIIARKGGKVSAGSEGTGTTTPTTPTTPETPDTPDNPGTGGGTTPTTPDTPSDPGTGGGDNNSGGFDEG